MRIAVKPALWRLWLTALLCSLSTQAQLRNDHLALIRQGTELLVEVASGASGPADRIEIRLNKASAREAKLAFGPEGWTARGEGAAVILSGPGLGRFPAIFRIALGQAKTPPLAHVVVSIAGETVTARDVPLAGLPAATVNEGVEGLLAAPAVALPGEGVMARVLIPGATPPAGTWHVGGAPAESVGEAIRFLVPLEASGEIGLPVRYVDPWGRTTVRGEVRILAEPSARGPATPILKTVQPIALAGEALTVCGWFPPQARHGVLLDARPDLELAGGSSRSLVFTLPEHTSPGRHLLSGDPDVGFSSDILDFEAIRLDASVDPAIDPPHVRIKVRGTRKPVRLRVVNLNPLAASLEGGESQIAESDGGIENLAMIPLRPGGIVGADAPDLNIVFTLATEAPACGKQSVATASSAARPMAN